MGFDGCKVSWLPPHILLTPCQPLAAIREFPIAEHALGLAPSEGLRLEQRADAGWTPVLALPFWTSTDPNARRRAVDTS